MRNKVYILSEDLQFFYRINQELKTLKIKFKVLNFWNKLPVKPSIILTTSDEINKIKNYENYKERILTYSKEDDFDKYIFKILAGHRVGIKDYSELTISIDPGTKYFGLIAFLDDFFLYSKTFYNKEELITFIRDFINNIQEGNTNLIDISLKFGQGVLTTTTEIINAIISNFKGRNNLKILLIDEKRSSKMRIIIDDKKFPKHEAAALIIALREGIEVNQGNYVKVIKQLRSRNAIKDNSDNNKIDTYQEKKPSYSQIAKKLLAGDLSLSESSVQFKEWDEFA